MSPDPDLILFWLADRIDERGWGLDGDTFHAMDRLRARGEDVWFNLGDEDLEIGRDRLRRLRAGERLTDTIEALRATLGVTARVLPMCDEPAPTFVGGTPFQEWMIRLGAPPGEVELSGGAMTPEVRAAIEAADAVVVGPSNPVISIDPILALDGMRDLLAAKTVVAISPFVNGEILKGPTATFLPSHEAVVAHYGDLVDGWLTDLWLGDADARSRGAADVLAFVKGLRP